MGKAILCALLLLLASKAVAQVPVTVVDSRNTRYQMQREVITRWNRFNPRWYFILFHNKYRKGPDRRNMLQLTPAMAFVMTNRDKAEEQAEAVDTVYQQEVFQFADRSMNKSYHLFHKQKIDKLNGAIEVLNAQAISLGVTADYILKLKAQQDRINTDIDLINDSYEDDANKSEQLRVYIGELEDLRGFYVRINSLFKISNKHTQ